MSVPSLADRLALVAADSVLVGHPVVAELVAAVETLEGELASLREENAERQRQLVQHSDQPGHAGTTQLQVAGDRIDSMSTIGRTGAAVAV